MKCPVAAFDETMRPNRPSGANRHTGMLFGNRLSLVKIFGFQISIDPSWVFLFFLISYTLAQAIYPSEYPDTSTTTLWIMGLSTTILLFLSVLVHEIGHSVVAHSHDMSVKGITLFLFGAVAEIDSEPPTPHAEFQIAIVGPVVSIVLGVVFYCLFSIGRGLELPMESTGVLKYLSTLNIVLAVFNLLPAFPLDGGRVLRAALWAWKHNLVWASKIACRIGSGFGLALAGLGIITALGGNFIGGMWWLLIGIFIKSAARHSFEQTLLRKLLREETVAQLMSTNVVAVPSDVSIQEFVDLYLYKHNHKVFPVTQGTRLLGYTHMSDLKSIPRAQWSARSIQSLIRKCSPENTIRPDVCAMEALTLMSNTNSSRLLVAKDAKLVGIVSLKDLLKRLSISMELQNYSEGAQ